jgi:hypothetical protein
LTASDAESNTANWLKRKLRLRGIRGVALDEFPFLCPLRFLAHERAFFIRSARLRRGVSSLSSGSKRAGSFDVRSVKKTCIHIVHPDSRLIPFDTYNLFYRDDLESTRLAALRHPVTFISSVASSAGQLSKPH